MKKKVLITGATGFVGSNLARRLMSEGCEVHILVRKTSNMDELNSFKELLTIHIHDGSIEGMFEALEQAKPEIVFHLASMVLSSHEPKDVVHLLQSNITFCTQLVEAMTRHECHLLVNTGTFWQNYDNKSYSPVNLYAATKQAMEVILQYYIEANQLSVITLKLFDTYGPNDPRPKILSLLKKASKVGAPLAMSAGEQLIDLVFISDVVDAYIAAAERLLKGGVAGHECYSVSSCHPIKLRDLVSVYEDVMQTSLPIQWGCRPYREREIMIPWNKGNILPGWACKVNLVDGIEKFLSGTDLKNA